jgi:sugar phosphate isomerase/epimerase
MTIRRGLATPAAMDYREAIPAAAEAGLDVVELAMEGPHRPSEVHDAASEVNALAATEGVELFVDLPFGLDLASPNKRIRRTARQGHEEAIEAAAAAGATTAVLRAETAAYRPAYDDERLRERFVEMALDLDSYADHAGLRLCVEYRGNDFLTLDRGFPRLFESGVAACLDTGRAYAAGLDALDQAALFVERGDMIGHVHLTDVDASGERVPLGTGALGVDRLLAHARDAWSGPVSAVATGGRRSLGTVLDRFDDAFERPSAHHGHPGRA